MASKRVLSEEAQACYNKIKAYNKLIHTDWADVEHKLSADNIMQLFMNMKEALESEDADELRQSGADRQIAGHYQMIIDHTLKLMKEADQSKQKLDAHGTFALIKNGYLNARSEYLKDQATPVYANKKNLRELVTGKGNVFTNIEKLLNSGDRALRGSSDAYKEIQRDVKRLSTMFKNYGSKLRTDEKTQQFMEKKFDELIVKANQYIEDRKDVAINYSHKSYKGKRVDMMKQTLQLLLIAKEESREILEKKVLDNAVDEGLFNTLNEKLFSKAPDMKAWPNSQRTPLDNQKDRLNEYAGRVLLQKGIDNENLLTQVRRNRGMLSIALEIADEAVKTGNTVALEKAIKENKAKIESMKNKSASTEQTNASTNENDKQNKLIREAEQDFLEKVGEIYATALGAIATKNKAMVETL